MAERLSVSQDTEFDPWELRAQAHRVLGTLLIAAGYLWLAGSLASHKGFSWSLLPPVSLLSGAAASIVLRRRSIRAAVYLLVVSLGATSLACVGLYGVQNAALFVIPAVLFAGVLVNSGAMAALTIILALGVLAGGALSSSGGRALTRESGYALGLLAMTALAAWLSGRNLYTALSWALDSYGRARAERDRRREQQGKLRQALKSMDEASFRLQRMNYELARARDVAEELRQFKQQFVTNVSHELRTPLALISGFSEMMYLSPDSYGELLPIAYQGDMREVYRNSQHLLSLIEDVLDLSRISAGKMLIAREKVDPLPIILEAANEIRPLIEGKGLRLELCLPQTMPPAYLDPTRLRQILLNLLNNARRFTDQGYVRLEAQARDGMMVIRVSDSGIGIQPADQTKLFEEFRQLDSSLARQHDGTGLGLKISKEFVELHAGRIWVESEGIRGKGSVFAFEIPLEEAPALEGDGMIRTPTRPPTALARNVVLVSQDDSIVPLLKRNLDGFQVLPVTDWREVGAAVDACWPEAVILNPSRGRELDELGRLRSLLAGRDVPIILCPLAGAGQLTSYLGVQAYLVKPIERDRLTGTLAQVLDKWSEPNDSSALGDGSTILIVDDDPRMVRLLTRMLDSAEESYHILRAPTATDALAQLGAQRVDAILLDIILPGMDGYAFLDVLRRDEQLASIPVIILTSLGYDLADQAYLGGPLVAISHQGGLSNPEALGLAKGLLEAQGKLPSRPGRTAILSPTERGGMDGSQG